MKITRIEARPVRLARDIVQATATAGSPTVLAPAAGDYRWSSVYPCLYSVNFETALVRIETDAGIHGWGEGQAPLAPEVVCAIIDRLLAPVLAGEEVDPEVLWDRMYNTMRVRGQTGGFMIDAISAIDIALWDIRGRAEGVPVARLLAAAPKERLPAYLSGLAKGASPEPFTQVKLFYDTHTPEEFFNSWPGGVQVAADALWRHTPASAVEFGAELDRRGALWFEAPLAPEDPLAHAGLARQLRTPIALGESYRTRYEMAPFFRERALGLFQPDLGRSGITEGMRLAAIAAAHGISVVPHVSIAFGPQLAAALHFAAAAENCGLVEYNPQVVAIANRYLAKPIEMEGCSYVVPEGPGLGIELSWP
jgi:galactonate dehydratase